MCITLHYDRLVCGLSFEDAAELRARPYSITQRRIYGPENSGTSVAR
jgi:hypothetical protein